MTWCGFLQYLLTSLRLYRPKRHSLTILNNVSGYVKPGRFVVSEAITSHLQLMCMFLVYGR